MRVTDAMRDHVRPFVTPISKVLSADHGEHLGSGSYCSFGTRTYLLTNEHVACHIQQASLGQQFFGLDDVFRVASPFVAHPLPYDIAGSALDSSAWNSGLHQAQPIPEIRFAKRHASADDELLLLMGFAYQRSTFVFGNLVTPVTSYLSQEVGLPEDPRCDPIHHFALLYRPDLADVVSGGKSELPVPPGLSGSLVWNTHAVSCISEGREWDPSLAEVKG